MHGTHEQMQAGRTYDRVKAFEWSSATLGIGAFVLALAWWLESAAFIGSDPVVPFALAAGAAMLLQARFPRRWRIETRGLLWTMTLLVLVGSYIITTSVLYAPYQSAEYVLLPAIAALVFAGRRQVLIIVAVAAAWTVATMATGLVQPRAADVATTGLGLAAVAVVANILHGQRGQSADLADRLMQERGALDAVLRSSPDAIFDVGAGGDVRFSNPAGKDWCQAVAGVTDDDRQFWMALPAPARNLFENAVYDARKGASVRIRFQADRGGTARTWEASLSPHVEEDAAIVLIRDVSEHSKQRSRLAAARREIEREMLNMVSHQLSTPITPILLSTALLRRRLGDRASEADLREIDRIERNARRSIAMVGELIERSRSRAMQGLEDEAHEDSRGAAHLAWQAHRVERPRPHARRIRDSTRPARQPGKDRPRREWEEDREPATDEHVPRH